MNAHGQALLVGGPAGKSVFVQADLRQPEAVVSDPVVVETLDFGQPIALILAGVLHFISDEDQPARIVKTLVDALPPGNYLVASHGTHEYSAEAGAGMKAARQGTGIGGQDRSSEEFADLVLPGLILVPPGVVTVSEWRPSDAIVPLRSEAGHNALVARKG